MGYPNEIVRFRRVKNRDLTIGEPGDIILAEDHNELAETLEAVQETLGVNPQGSYASVAERLDNIGGGGVRTIILQSNTEMEATGDWQVIEDARAEVNITQEEKVTGIIAIGIILTQGVPSNYEIYIALAKDNFQTFSVIYTIGYQGEPKNLMQNQIPSLKIPQTQYIYPMVKISQGVKYILKKIVLQLYIEL